MTFPSGEMMDKTLLEMAAEIVQAKALGHILEHGSLTIQDYERLCPEINRRSLQRDLKAMVDKGVVFEKATSPTDPTKRYVLVERALR